MISNEVKEQLGLKDEKKEAKGPSKARAGGGKSILKKNSVLLGESKEKATSELGKEEKSAKKPKKSVMFTKSRFAE